MSEKEPWEDKSLRAEPSKMAAIKLKDTSIKRRSEKNNAFAWNWISSIVNDPGIVIFNYD